MQINLPNLLTRFNRNAATEAGCICTKSNELSDLFLATHRHAEPMLPYCWISPLTRIWVEKSSPIHFEARMLLLTGLSRRWLATFLDADGHQVVTTASSLKERARLRQNLERFGTVSKDSGSEAGAMYESCRWASLILLSMEKQKIPLHIAPKVVQDKPRVIAHLRKTNLSDLWGSHKGLLLWVIAVCHFSSAGKCLPLLCTTLFARISQELAMSDCFVEAAINPLRRLRQFEKICCQSPCQSHVPLPTSC